MTNTTRRLIISLTGIGLTLILVGLLPFIAAAQDATATPEPPPAAPAEGQAETVYDASAQAIQPTGDNSYCIVCHNQPLHTVTMQDGNILNLYVNPDIVADSVHGVDNPVGALGCVDCHGADSFPHDGPTPVNQREYTLRSVQFCIGCHLDQVTELENGLHERAILAGNPAAAVCTDCHGVHDTQPVEEFPELVAGVCGDCHQTTLGQWQSSAHVDIGPLDCATCHSPHSQLLRVGTTTDELCLNCHKDMPEVFTHAQHVREGSEAACVDCHMFAPPNGGLQTVALGTAGVDAAGANHNMLVETVACNTCHEELVTSGRWAELRPAVTGSQAEMAGPTPNVQEAAAEAVEATPDFIQLLQGLILGIGFGITAAAVFVSRGNRLRTEQGADHE